MLTVRSISAVVEAWSEAAGRPVSWQEMVSVRRSKPVCRARALVIWLARRHTSLSLPQIGRQMGGRDHTTILHNCRVIDALLAADDAETVAAVARLEAGLAPLLETAQPLEPEAMPPETRALARGAVLDQLVDAVDAVLTSADAAALARGTRRARDADLALSRALTALRSAQCRVMASGAERPVCARTHRPSAAAPHATAA
jgi:hypothetical protein